MKSFRCMGLIAAFLIALGTAWAQAVPNLQMVGSNNHSIISSTDPAAVSLDQPTVKETIRLVALDTIAKTGFVSNTVKVNANCAPPNSSFALVGFNGVGNSAITHATTDPNINNGDVISARTFATAKGCLVASMHEVDDLNARFKDEIAAFLADARKKSGNPKLDVVLVRINPTPQPANSYVIVTGATTNTATMIAPAPNAPTPLLNSTAAPTAISVVQSTQVNPAGG